MIFPFGPLKPGEWSFAPPKPQTDLENSMNLLRRHGRGQDGWHLA